MNSPTPVPPELCPSYGWPTPAPAVAVDELAALRAENLRLREALEFYAGHRDGKWDEWHVCDSYSGAGALFDWNGDTQDDPWEVARKALAATPAPCGMSSSAGNGKGDV